MQTVSILISIGVVKCSLSLWCFFLSLSACLAVALFSVKVCWCVWFGCCPPTRGAACSHKPFQPTATCADLEYEAKYELMNVKLL